MCGASSFTGYSNAMRYVLTGEEFDADEAYRMAVVQEIVDIVPVQRELINSEDAMEAATAMMQRRSPVFKGR